MYYSDNIAVDRSRLTDYDFIRTRLFLRLINPRINRTSYMNSPYTSFLDLKIVYHIMIEETVDKVASVRVDNHLFDQYGVSLETLHADALKGSVKMFPSRILPVSSMLNHADEEKGWKEDPAIICITNTDGMYGATSIVYPDTLKTITEKVNANLYIIPSSVDECIAVTDSDNIIPGKIKDLLNDVNRTLLRSYQRLSDHLYYYDRRSDQLMSMT